MSMSDTIPGTLSSLILVPQCVNELLEYLPSEGIDRLNHDLHEVIDLMTISSRLHPESQVLHTLLSEIKAFVPDTGATDATEASPQMSRLPVAVVSLLPSALAAIEETAEKLAAGDSQALETAWRGKHNRRVAKHVRMENLSRARRDARRAAGEAPDSLEDEARSTYLSTSRRSIMVNSSQPSADDLKQFRADIQAGVTERLLPNLKLLKQRSEEITRKSGGDQTAAYGDWVAESSRAEQIFQQWLASKQAGSSAEQMEVDNDPMDMDRGGVGQQLEAGTLTVPGAPGRGFKRSANLLSGDGEEAADEHASSVKIVRRS